MPWGWIAFGLAALALFVLVRWLLKAASGVTTARERAFVALRRVLPEVDTVARAPGLVVLVAGEDRLELDYAAVLAVSLKAPTPEALEDGLERLASEALLAQTDPEQLADEREEAAEVLGEGAEDIDDEALLLSLFGLDDPHVRAEALRDLAQEAT